jgi:hypothetical protein
MGTVSVAPNTRDKTVGEITTAAGARREPMRSGTRGPKPGFGQERKVNVKQLAITVAVTALLTCASTTNASAQQFTMIVDVGSSTASVGMGPGGMLSTGGGTVTVDGQPIGTFMHTTQAMTMAGMMGQMASFQQRMVTFQLPGIGTVFAMMAGGNPWSGAKGIIMGGTDAAHGISGSVTVGDEVSANHYSVVVTLGP